MLSVAVSVIFYLKKSLKTGISQLLPSQNKYKKYFLIVFYKNKFGTVTVKTKNAIEITTFRTEQDYTDKRHPDKISFTSDLKKDLSRRDFTINALAMDKNKKIIDLFNGKKDIEKKIIRAVGKSKKTLFRRRLAYASRYSFCCRTSRQRRAKPLAGI